MQREQAEEKLKKLLADRELMTVKSPIDGIVYYGKCVRGKSSDSTSLAESLRRHGAIQPNQVVMTVVQPRPMFIRATAPEEQLHDLRPGLKGVATPAGYPELKLPATIDDVSDIPTAPGSFDARLTVVLEPQDEVAHARHDLQGEAGAVSEEGCAHRAAEGRLAPTSWTTRNTPSRCWRRTARRRRRAVTLGEKTDKQVEILKGLSRGREGRAGSRRRSRSERRLGTRYA